MPLPRAVPHTQAWGDPPSYVLARAPLPALPPPPPPPPPPPLPSTTRPHAYPFPKARSGEEEEEEKGKEGRLIKQRRTGALPVGIGWLMVGDKVG